MRVEILPVGYAALSGEETGFRPGRTSEELRNEVEAARKVQIKRYELETISYNSQLSSAQIRKYCVLDRECKAFAAKCI